MHSDDVSLRDSFASYKYSQLWCFVQKKVKSKKKKKSVSTSSVASESVIRYARASTSRKVYIRRGDIPLNYGKVYRRAIAAPEETSCRSRGKHSRLKTLAVERNGAE